MSSDLSIGFHCVPLEREPISITIAPDPCPASITMPDGQHFEAFGDTPREAMVNLLEKLKAHYGRPFRLTWGDGPNERIEV